jgi:hypothetical protein
VFCATLFVKSDLILAIYMQKYCNYAKNIQILSRLETPALVDEWERVNKG